jgi:rare lipoprotein A
VLVASCSTSRPAPQSSGNAVRSQPGLDINRAHKDGAPWWDVDVSRSPMPRRPCTPATTRPTRTRCWARPISRCRTRELRAEGTASWYGTKFHGQNTANGEVYDLYGMSAAHKTLPLPVTCG